MLNRKVRASRALRGCGKRLALLRQGYDVGSSPTTAYFKARLIRAFSFKISTMRDAEDPEIVIIAKTMESIIKLIKI